MSSADADVFDPVLADDAFDPADNDIDDVDPPPAVPLIADDIEYVSLNAVDFTDKSFAWSNPITSTAVRHLPDPDPTKGPYDSMVKATLHQLNIRTNHDEEPLRVPAAPVCHVNGPLLATEPPPLHVNYAAPRAQLDTGDRVSCTDKLYILHDYCAYDGDFPCPVRLIAALDKSNQVLPLGEGYLYVPAINRQDFVAVRCFYSPHLTSTLIVSNRT